MTGLDDGVVELTLDDERVVLRPTLEAIQTLCRRYEGILPLLQRLRQLDLNAAVDVVMAGAGMAERDRRSVAERLWRNAEPDWMARVQEFALVLSNGGRPLAADDGADDGAGKGKSGETGRGNRSRSKS